MVNVRTEGLDELINEMEELHQEADVVFDELIKLGAEEIKLQWKLSAEKSKHRMTGDMINSIDITLKGKEGQYKIAHILPKGNDRVGVRNASKAFWRHYGTSKKPGTYWVDTAEEEASKRIPEILYNRWREYLSKKR